MSVLLWIIIAIAILFIINTIFLVVYCRLAEKIDRKLNSNNTNDGRTMESKQEESKSEKSNKSNLKGLLYNKLNGYCYGWMRYCIVKVGHFPSHRIRNLLYRFVFNMKITKRTVIYGDCEIRSPWNIKADNCVISTGCILDGRKGITIGNNTVFGGHVHIWTEEHDLDDPMFAVNSNHAQPVIIGERCWICSDSTVLPGVTIGNNAVVAARAVIVKSCEEYGVYAGVPAKFIRYRNKDLRYILSGKPHWHFW